MESKFGAKVQRTKIKHLILSDGSHGYVLAS